MIKIDSDSTPEKKLPWYFSIMKEKRKTSWIVSDDISLDPIFMIPVGSLKRDHLLFLLPFSFFSFCLFSLTFKWVTEEKVTCPLDALAAHFCMEEAKHTLMNCHKIRKCIYEWCTSGGQWPEGRFFPPLAVPPGERPSSEMQQAGRVAGMSSLQKVSINHAAMPKTASTLHSPSPPLSRPPSHPFLSLLSSSPVSDHRP